MINQTIKEKEFEIRNIVAWLSGYIGVMEGHKRLKEEIIKLEKLIK
jgi:hypothetical protein